MAEADHHELIIVRRHEDEEHEHHSSAWKVAHADFMTAMMAFFLIMWLINVTDEEAKKSIANYFNPVRLSESVTNRKGLNDPKEIHPQGPEEEPGEQKTTLDETPAEHPTETSGTTEEPGGETSGDHKGKAASEHDGGAAAEQESEAATQGEASQQPMSPKVGNGGAEDAEEAAFADPYAVLAELAAEVPPAETPSADVAVGDTRLQGPEAGEAYRDPFDPAYWQMAAVDSARAETPGLIDNADEMPAEGRPDAAAPREREEAPLQKAAESRSPEAQADRRDPQTAPTAEEDAEAEAIATELEAALRERLGSTQAPNVEVRATDEGILISLTDEMDFSMFEIGSAVPKPVVVVAMDQVADVLAGRSGRIVIRGYTDGRPFRSKDYDNWRLSTARAHMTSYMLTRGRLSESRIHKIEGFADRNLKNPEDPNAAENRRIEILLQEQQA